MRYVVVIAILIIAFYIGFKISPKYYRIKNKGYCANTSELKKMLRSEILELEKQNPMTEGMKIRRDELIRTLKVFNNCKSFDENYICLDKR